MYALGREIEPYEHAARSRAIVRAAAKNDYPDLVARDGDCIE